MIKYLKLFIIILILASVIINCEKKKSDKVKDIMNYQPANIIKGDIMDGETVIVAGRLRRVGSAPFSELVLTPLSNFDIYFDKEFNLQDSIIVDLQEEFIEIKGRIIKEKMLSPSGGLVHYKYIISPEEVRKLIIEE